MGTTWNVKINAPNIVEEQFGEGIQAVLDRIETRMSTYRSDSEVSRFNRSHSTDWYPLSAETAKVVAEALRIGTLTGGAFDITVGPLVELWGFGPDFHPDQIPAQGLLDAALIHTGYQKLAVRMDPPALRKSDPGIQIDLSGIAKGYAVDAVAAYMRQLGMKNFMVEVGGEVYVAGHKDGGLPWRIAIERPADKGLAVERTLTLTDQGMATSGDYRNYFLLGGVRYSHTIDPHTGWPVRHHPASATVVHASTMTADALATTMLVLGRERGLALAQREGLAVFLIERDRQGFKEYASPAFRRLLQADLETEE